MKATKKSGRTLGVLFLSTIALGVIGTIFRGLSGTDIDTLDFLSMVAEKANEMKWAIGLDIVGSATMLVITLFLFPLIKKFSPRLALGYVGLAIINFVIIVVSNILHVMLLSLSTNISADATIPATENLIATGKMLYESYYWTHFLMLVLYSIANSMLFYFLLKEQYLPKWLSIWGLMASALVFVGGALQLAEIEVSFLLFAQNGIFMLFFTGWLLIRGFKDPSSTGSFAKIE
ncbi:DUF4386 family protein [Muricauda sp. JGD-17]|uniref:DUF4386 family protein n=1 Tax=Flagellimonas ochracea TaxID=2696472 RepID=A0A964WXU4_9FLAO|nr:DUF4386 domain-containing protein [Allomuricauda ochracea]NAY92425.1 DUF4386 family protein [Allomuricauda ochracea]